MRRRVWIAAVLLMLVFVTFLAYGIYLGDAGLVLDNAQAICFT